MWYGFEQNENQNSTSNKISAFLQNNLKKRHTVPDQFGKFAVDFKFIPICQNITSVQLRLYLS